MRKILLIPLIILLHYATIQGQSVVTGTAIYKLTVNGHVTQNGSSCGDNITPGLQWIVANYQNGTKKTLVRGGSDYPNNGHGLRHTDFGGDYTFTKHNKVTQLIYRTVYRDHKWLGGCQDVEPATISRGVNTCYKADYDFGGLNQPGWCTELIYPVVTLNTPDSQNRRIADEEYLIIALTDSIDNQYYNWEYSIDGSATFLKIPAAYNKKSTLRIKGKDFLTDASIGKSVYIRVNMGNCAGQERTSNAITFTYFKSAPYIDSVTYQLPTCHKQDDAKLFVHFDRDLLPDEKLYLSIAGNRFTNKVTLDPSSKMMEIPGLLADTFNIRLLGSYRINPTDTVFTFTDGTRHKYDIRIPERPAIFLDSIAEAAVHCYNGSDGKIFVRASGGTGIFDALLYKDDLYQDSIRFTTNDIAEFKELNKGLYKVLIQDTNGCIWDASGNPVVGTINVTEPNDNVVILGHRHEEPKGFGLTNGWAQVTFKGGTSNSYHVVWKDSLNNIIPNTITPDGSTFITKVENIKSSTYFVTIQDANYPLADPRTEENLCGCTDTISFFVEEPPKLKVVLDEQRYVTCNGDKDGQVVAHATGGRPHLSGLPYTYDWMKVEGATLVPVSQTDSIITELYSGHYRVKITDRNGITTISEDYHLVEPEPLIVTTKVLRNISCSGESTGIIEATATGGTPPYTYIWSTNDTTKVVNNLPQGNYVVGVRDARYMENIMKHYCFAQAYDSIMAPDPIKLNPVVTDPLCHGYSNGEIKLNVTGGILPYSYIWEDGSTQANRNNLPEGEYHVKVTDANGCFMEETYRLIQPEPVIVNLGNDITLCKNQKITVDGEIDLPNISYQWTNTEGNILSTSSSLDIDKAGKYTLKATTVDGCFGQDEIMIYESDDEVIPDFIIATQVVNSTKVYAVNLTLTQSDSIKWIIPENVQIIEKLNDRVQLIFPENGDYIIGMSVHKNKCMDILYKTVSVVNKGDVEEDNAEEPFIKRFIISPNPNNGSFQAIVELREPADYVLYLFDTSGRLIGTKKIYNQMYATTQFDNTGVNSGVYYLRLVSSKATSVFNIIIK